MLLRAAGRRQQRRPPNQRTPNSLAHLPFLWPAGAIWSASQPRLLTRNPQKCTGRQNPLPPHVRSLASFTAPPEPLSAYEPPLNTSTPPRLRWDYGITKPAPENLLFHQVAVVAPPKVRRTIFGNNSSDLIQNLYASIRVGRLERAQRIVKRLAMMDDADASEVMHAHETYLEALSVAQEDPDQTFRDLYAYYTKNHMCNTETTSVHIHIVMIRAALDTTDWMKQQRKIRNIVEQSGVGYEEIVLSGSLTETGLQRLQSLLGLASMETDGGVESDLSSPHGDSDDVVATSRYDLQASDLPELLQAKQKGFGLASLKSVLKAQDNYDTESRSEHLDAEARLLRDHERERLLENTAAEAAVARWRQEDEQLQALGILSNLNNRTINGLMWRWYNDLVPVMQKELDIVKQRMDSDTTLSSGRILAAEADVYGPYMEQASAEKLAVNTIICIMTTLAKEKDQATGEFSNHAKLADTAKQIATQIESEVNADRIQKERLASARRASQGRNRSKLASTRQLKGRVPTRRASPEHPEWPLAAKIALGTLLIARFMETAKMMITREHPRTKEKITRLKPAFLQKLTYRRGKRSVVLTAVPDLKEKMRREPVGGLICKKLPMLVEPKPWKGFKDGGYLNYATDFVRLPPTDSTPSDYAKAAIEKGHIDPVLRAMTALGKIPWRINNDVLRVQIEAWNSGEAVGNFAPLDPKLDPPPKPTVSQDPHARSKYLTELHEYNDKISGLHSQRCFQNLQLEIARAFRNDKMYFPHNVDFRGRAYPIPPYLNHMGADNARALMLFDKGKPLGEHGLRWLKIHLANVFGYDKASFLERERFVMDHLDDIYDSADRPMTGRRWWQQSEDAWQTLAACFELKHALECEDPTKFISHLPLHQDGTCNGLQHYAALGGDEAGARQVNLVPSDRPSDVYAAVADGVIAAIEADVAEGHPIAKMLQGKITRKVVKQPVMTNVYGVTYFGARQQVKRQLEAIFPDVKTGDLINHQTLASYVARKIFNSLGEMFRGAQSIQEWLSKSANRIATSVTPEQIEALRAAANKKGKKKKVKANNLFKSTVIWTTPLRFPVVQPYRDAPTKPIKTALSAVSIAEPQVWDPVSRRKQMQGFPPNFIHSLDATHMMLSALKCEEKDITFASIHDSFWTHACDREELSEILRGAFIWMHKEDIVGRLKEEFDARYKGCLYLESIDGHSRAGRKILTYRKSKHMTALLQKYANGLKGTEGEMVLESERLRLMNSDDQKEREEGLAMRTPASIFAEEGGEDVVVPPTGLSVQRLGHAPEGDPAEVQDAKEVAETCASDMDDAEKLDDRDLEADADADPDPDPDAEAEAETQADTEAGTEEVEGWTSNAPNEVEQRMQLLGISTGEKKSNAYKVKAPVWLPLTFPEKPAKGSFDVGRLRESKYFFH